MDEDVPCFQRFQQTLGPLGRDVVPAGEDTFEELVDAYKQRLKPGEGPVHVSCMTTLSECRAAVLAARERNCFPVWVSWACDDDGRSVTGVHILAALFVAEGMGASGFGLHCAPADLLEQMDTLARYASVPLFSVRDGQTVPYPYSPREHDPDVIPCSTGESPCFVTRTVDVGEDLTCGPDLLERIIEAEDNPVAAVKIVINHPDDVAIFAQHQYAIRDALCLCSDVPELLESALRVYQGRAFYDGTGDLEPDELDRLSRIYGLIVL